MFKGLPTPQVAVVPTSPSAISNGTQAKQLQGSQEDVVSVANNKTLK